MAFNKSQAGAVRRGFRLRCAWGKAGVFQVMAWRGRTDIIFSLCFLVRKIFPYICGFLTAVDVCCFPLVTCPFVSSLRESRSSERRSGNSLQF